MEIGGQAVLEGVMLRAADCYAVAVRKPDGKIIVQRKRYVPLTKRHRILGLPFIRGVVSLGEMLVIGMRALNYSSSVATEEEDSGWTGVVAVVLAIALAIFLFKYLPLLAAQLVTERIRPQTGSVLFSLLDGLFKIAIFFAYVVIISRWSEMRRVFQYHGAEHKTVHCAESRRPLTVKNIRKFSPVHRRCGTSFILIFLLLSVLVYSIVPQHLSFGAKLGLRLALLPFIAGISYEILKLAGRHPKNWLLQAVSYPGLLFQRLTTAEPDDRQIMVAVAALKAVKGRTCGKRGRQTGTGKA